ncbi:MAG TPA: hypothetical protein VLC10_00570, partial [Patescibacteria group bacterium]|nr:hypothetical protein [Patescibacteria group bacterium]
AFRAGGSVHHRKMKRKKRRPLARPSEGLSIFFRPCRERRGPDFFCAFTLQQFAQELPAGCSADFPTVTLYRLKNRLFPASKIAVLPTELSPQSPADGEGPAALTREIVDLVVWAMEVSRKDQENLTTLHEQLIEPQRAETSIDEPPAQAQSEQGAQGRIRHRSILHHHRQLDPRGGLLVAAAFGNSGKVLLPPG